MDMAKTRKLHLISLGLTTFSWLVPGIWYGFGYCFLTDRHWEIKEKFGQTGLPASFIYLKIFPNRHIKA